ncbi:MAG: polyphosphate kinase 2 family protein [Ignavibacteriaceae bacterium]|nr:polyphosphate kinase 2 family protein [Ignavibacteriaceae bacterium]
MANYIGKFRVKGPEKVTPADFPTAFTGDFTNKSEAAESLEANVKRMSDLQDMMYAHDKWAVLLIFQAMDAAGKDGAIKHVMSGLNPQGTQVFSFKQPSAEELDHDYMWRYNKSLPERGRIGIFNRSYYEELLVVKVHNLIKYQKLPDQVVNKNIWKSRYRQIKDYERYLFENGVLVLKFFLNVSKDEQKRRFLQRLEDPAKNWKFSEADVRERRYWDDYQKAYGEAICNTATEIAPWYVIPADKKWYARFLISQIIVDNLEKLGVHYPKLDDEQLSKLAIYAEMLNNEK